MMDFLKKLSNGFSAGALGGLLHVIIFILIVYYGLTNNIGVSFRLPITTGGLEHLVYSSIIWGGVWGFLFAFPIVPKSWWLRGLLIGTFPSLVTLFVLFPQEGLGLLGTGYGNLAFLVILLLNWAWGVIAAGWYEHCA